jgi:hypothetical protein
MAVWYEALQAPAPPRLRLITFAGVALPGTPETVSPAAHRIASMMSES